MNNNSAVCDIPTVPISEACYAVLLHGSLKECYGSFEEATYAYSRWLEQFQPHARKAVSLIRLGEVVAPGQEIDFY